MNKAELDVANAKAQYEMIRSKLDDENSAKAQYEMIRSKLDDENEEFEFLKESYEKRSSKLTQDLIKAWSAYQSARIDSESAKKHIASAIEFIKTSMEEQQ